MYHVIHLRGEGKGQVTVEWDFCVIYMYSVIHLRGGGMGQVTVEHDFWVIILVILCSIWDDAA